MYYQCCYITVEPHYTKVSETAKVFYYQTAVLYDRHF